jgi:hypothetical protein
MKSHNDQYLSRLSLWLRVSGSAPARTVSVLAEVRTHLADSGENPYETFGAPRQYAKQFAQESKWSLARRSAALVALGSVAASCYLVADDVAHLSTQRPLWWSAPQWVFLIITAVLVVVAWQSALFFFSPPLTSLASADKVSDHAWKSRHRARIIVTTGVVVVVVGASLVWGRSLGNSYRDLPKLRTSTFVASNATADGHDIIVSVRTVIYLDAPQSGVTLNSADPSNGEDFNGLTAGSLQEFGSLAAALPVAKTTNWSLNGQDQVHGFAVVYGEYYVLSWMGAIYQSSQSNQQQIFLNLVYDVNRVGLQTLKIPLNTD